MTKPKIAYMFLMYDDVSLPKVWERYFDGHEDTTSICCHASNRATTTTPWLLKHQIPYWVSTGWGNLGLVVAQLELLRYAMRDIRTERFLLCSGSCAPIKTYQHTYDAVFEQERSWVNSHPRFQERMKHVTNIPYKDHRANPQWVMLTRKHAEFLVRFNFLADFVRCVIPDEHYAGSVLAHLGEEDNLLKQDQTCVDWVRVSPVQSSPVEHSTISDDYVAKWRKSPSLFARKFNHDSDLYERWYDIVGE